jgi:hypothetical protein
MADRPLVWVGVDVGKAAHHAYAIDPAGKVVFRGTAQLSQARGDDRIASKAWRRLPRACRES